MIIAGIIFVGVLCVAIIWSSMIVAKQTDEKKDECKKSMGSFSPEICSNQFDLEDVINNAEEEN